MTLDDVCINQIVKIKTLPTDYYTSSKLLEEGFTFNTELSVAHKAPFGGNIVIRIHNTKLCIPRSIAKQIEVN